MPKQRAPQEFNQFIGGINTDANPLNFPENSSLDEVNLVLDRDGSRRRRLGMDMETSYSTITTSVKNVALNNVAFKTFRWENAGGEADKNLLVVQCGNEIKIYDLDNSPISSTVLLTKRFSGVLSSAIMSFATVDGILVLVNGDGTIYSYEYDGEGTVTESESRIEVRDLWGVEDLYDPGTGEVDITEGNNANVRPTTLSDNHLYNLRNQSWGVARPSRDTLTEAVDCIEEFYEHGNDRTSGGIQNYPSNADSINEAFYANSSFTNEPFMKTFWARDLYRSPVGSTRSATGYFVIDLLNRGASRNSVMASNDAKFGNFVHTLATTLPADSTSGGATVTTEFAGRAWFAGFDGDNSNSDSKSPRLSSYVVFSRLVKNIDDINKCYQFADPTDFDDSDLVATDGGFIRIDGAYGIKAMVQAGSSLLIFAQNGVWRVIGGSDFGFAADNYSVERIRNAGGCRSANSVVDADGAVLYWGDDGIFVVATTELGDWGGKNISQDKVQELYDAIAVETKDLVSGIYNEFERKVIWLYNNGINDSNKTKELILDLDLNAFTTNEIQEIDGTTSKVVGLFNINPFAEESRTENITVNGQNVEVNGEQVQITYTVRVESNRKPSYVVVLRDTDEIQYSFASYTDTDFLDWKTLDSTGVDAAGYITTGYLGTGDNARRKQLPKLIVYCNRTEDGVYEDSGGQLQLSNPSSCLVQAQWNWTNSANANRWSTARQFYRYRRPYLPADINDTVDTGHSVIVSKDVIRGHGKNVSLKFSTEPGKDMQLQGWALDWEVGNAPGS